MKKLVLLGGGHAHVEVLRQFGLARPAGVDITLVNPGPHALYSGMLPGLIAGHYAPDDCRIDLRRLVHRAGGQLVQAQATALDAAARRITLADGQTLDYDLLSLNVGSMPAANGIPGVSEHAIAIKPFADFLPAWATLERHARSGEVRRIAVAGGGAAGVEVLLAMRYRLMQHPPAAATIFCLVSDSPRLAQRLAPGVGRALQAVLARRHIEVYTGAPVRALAEGALDAGGLSIAADAVVWATGPAPVAWLAGSGLALDEGGYLATGAALQSVSDAAVFAAGDCATIAGARYPKSGVYAVRQGPLLAHNLRACVAGAALQPYAPQRRALALISTGERHAIAAWGPFSVEGDWVWRWKDRIDRAFIAKYRG